MKIGKRPGEEFTIFLKGKQLSQESHFNYLGSLIKQDGSCEKEIRSRITLETNTLFYYEKRTADKSLEPLPEEDNYKDCHLEYSSIWSRIMDLEERGRAKAGEL